MVSPALLPNKLPSLTEKQKTEQLLLLFFSQHNYFANIILTKNNANNCEAAKSEGTTLANSHLGIPLAPYSLSCYNKNKIQLNSIIKGTTKK